MDFFPLKYMPTTIPSFIKDTDDFIRRICNIIDLPSDVLFVSLDVVSLCPSIPHDFGLCAPKDYQLDRSLPTIVVNGIHNMTELVLTIMCLNLTLSVPSKFCHSNSYQNGSGECQHCYVNI